MAAAAPRTPDPDDVISCPCRFSDLFSLAEEFEDSQAKPPKSRRKAPASSPRSRKGPAPPTTATEEESNSSSPSVGLGWEWGGNSRVGVSCNAIQYYTI